MELTPQTLHAVEFREARRGGYNTRDVDDFLERVAAGVGHLHERLREVVARAEAAEARLVDAQRQLDEVQRRGPAAAAATPAGAPSVGPSETDDTLRRTLVLAQRTADATIKEAKQEANRLIDEARAEASRTRMAAEDDARRGADQARVSVEAELDGLIDQRERIRIGISELRRIVDDEGQLSTDPVPGLADIDRPGPPLPSRAAYGSRGSEPPDPADDPGSPYGAGTSSQHVAALQEAPASDNGPWSQPMPFTSPGDAHRLGGGAGERAGWLPSELRTSPGDEPPPPGAPAATPVADEPPAAGAEPGANGTDRSAEPETRPSEWGRAVFDPEPTDRPEG